jgi:hypothetical protein
MQQRNKPQRERRLKPAENDIAVIDFETDPFLYGREPKPFCAGFYSLEVGFLSFWGEDCVIQLVDYITSIKKPLTIYAHNGGKFDFHFMLEFFDNPIKIISSRIALVKMGIHELRDSYCIIPIPLSTYQKDSIDYKLLEFDVREKHREEIIKYLKGDCVYLFDLVFKFIERFGKNLTIGGTAIKTLRKIHEFDTTTKPHDDKYRPYYFGGRVEAFKTGIIEGDFKVYDVNSMYPHVMKNMQHPTGKKYAVGYNRNIDRRGRIAGFVDAPFYFARIECDQLGAFPVRQKNAPLNFDIPHGEFFVTSHELKAAIECGRVSNIKIKEIRVPESVISFGEYVDKFMAEKIDAKKRGDKASEIFAKLLLNSAYGKFGQNPDHYYDYFIGEPDDLEKYEIYSADLNSVDIWRKKSERLAFYDVATAASITGAARSVLMRALANAKNAVYCDTDSVICESLNEQLDASALGAWKLEATGDTVAIAGKKMYALREGKDYVKVAAKGVSMTGQEIFGLCSGKSKTWRNDAPSFSLGEKRLKFVQRTIAPRFVSGVE